MMKPAAVTGSLILAGGSYRDASRVARKLRENGYSCVCSPDYRTFEQHTRWLKPDLLLLDIGIYEEFFGDAKRREQVQAIPAIHLVSTAADRTRAFAAGAVDYIIKPVLTEELLLRVRAQIELLQTQKQLAQRNMQFATTLENIGQGVCFFDSDQRLILSNRRYAEVYGLPPELVRPGMTLSEITQLRYSVGACPVVPHDEYLAWCDSINSKSSPQDWTMELKSGKVIRVHHERTANGGWVSTHEDITEHRNAERQIAHLALHDPLTDLPNRAALKQKLETLLEQHRTQGSQFAVLCLDLDRFKEVNDLFGHNVGDMVLCLAAKRLCAAAVGAFVARLGGDEFMVLAEADASSAAQLADLTITVLSEDAEIEGTRIRMGTSIGVAIFPADGDNAAELISNADAALYRAKADGRGTARFFEPQMDKWLRERRALQRDLQAAISEQQLSIVYQPQANIGGGYHWL
ncbi:diguanylate cyclase (GGDEF)-like protein [Sinorhizobium kostiense]|uniref:Diguanylate cyclase (GGDEF)-like protein n=1 Tax=Sinorhizobium kostiense TaxID=76747 RepID=A0ABS4R118_9HYPH|nr:diguanylate cyclase (GGDEF)-like protein [Sinorhizobium kostiense]